MTVVCEGRLKHIYNWKGKCQLCCALKVALRPRGSCRYPARRGGGASAGCAASRALTSMLTRPALRAHTGRGARAEGGVAVRESATADGGSALVTPSPADYAHELLRRRVVGCVALHVVAGAADVQQAAAEGARAGRVA